VCAHLSLAPLSLQRLEEGDEEKEERKSKAELAAFAAKRKVWRHHVT